MSKYIYYVLSLRELRVLAVVRSHLIKKLLHADFLTLFAGELTKVTVLAEPQGVVRLVSVSTLICKFGPPMTMVAGLAKALCVERSACVWTGVYLLRLSLLLLGGAKSISPTAVIVVREEFSVKIRFLGLLFKITHFAGNNRYRGFVSYVVMFNHVIVFCSEIK